MSTTPERTRTADSPDGGLAGTVADANSYETRELETPGETALATKRVVMTMGGKGGTGKTTLMTALAEWYREHELPFVLLDLDTENKAARGSVSHFFREAAHKINIHTPAGLDAFVDHLVGTEDRLVLADMGAGSGQVATQWFEDVYEDAAAAGIVFTAIGLVTPDSASVESVLSWANRLQDRVSYLIVENHASEHADLAYWREAEQAKRFREVFHPAVMSMDFRLPELENPARQHGVTLGQVAGRQTAVRELAKASLVMRAQAYRRRLFAEFDRVRELLLP